MQKRLIRKLDFELMLSQVEPYSNPDPRFEQYTISVNTAATLLFLAGYSHNDIVGKRVIELGCGTGRLALGAAFQGAKEVVGIDIDKKAIKSAHESSAKLGLSNKSAWIVSDIDAIQGRFDTVLENPPFGIQSKHADRKFIAKALELGDVVYTLHKSTHNGPSLLSKLKKCSDGAMRVSASPFMQRFVETRGGRVDVVYSMLMTIPHLFDFHTKHRHEFAVDLYVLRKK